jgi:hypothetical protein
VTACFGVMTQVALSLAGPALPATALVS